MGIHPDSFVLTTTGYTQLNKIKLFNEETQLWYTETDTYWTGLAWRPLKLVPDDEAGFWEIRMSNGLSVIASPGDRVVLAGRDFLGTTGRKILTDLVVGDELEPVLPNQFPGFATNERIFVTEIVTSVASQEQPWAWVGYDDNVEKCLAVQGVYIDSDNRGWS